MQKILIADDVMPHRESLRSMLQREYYLLEARDRTQVLEVLQACGKELGLILLNLESPRIGGLALLREVKQDPALEFVPVVIITEDVHKCDMGAAYEAGAVDFIIMGFPEVVSRQRIRRIVESSALSPMTNFRTLLESPHRNFFLFHNFIGAAMMMEYDGTRMRALMMNEEFYKVVGYGREHFEQFSDDLTESILPEEVQALVTLPGSIIYDYDPVNDQMVLNMSSDAGLHTICSENFLQQPENRQWLDPESEKIFRETYQRALSSAMGGSMDFKGRFGTKKFRWHRAYFRSMADRNGKVFRIVGRIDDLESSAWAGMPYEKFEIYDSATQLLTYHALKEFIAQKLGEERSGTMMLLDLDGLRQACSKIGTDGRAELLRQIANAMCGLFRKDDIFGKFGNEGFIIFLPEAYRQHLAYNMVQEIFDAVGVVLKNVEEEKVRCTIGVAIADNEETTVTDLLTHANTALWQAKEMGMRYAIYAGEMQGILTPEQIM